MVSKNYTLTRVTSGEQDLEWDTSASKYVLSSSLLVKPERLYAYAEKSIDMYAWTIEDGSEVTPSSCTTIYTKTPILDLNNGVFYDENGVEYTTSPKVTPDLTLKHSDSSNDFISTYILEATDEKITMGATSLD